MAIMSSSKSYRDVKKYIPEVEGSINVFKSGSTIRFILDVGLYRDFCRYCENKGWLKDKLFLKSQKKCAYYYLQHGDLIDSFIQYMKSDYRFDVSTLLLLRKSKVYR